MQQNFIQQEATQNLHAHPLAKQEGSHELHEMVHPKSHLKR